MKIIINNVRLLYAPQAVEPARYENDPKQPLRYRAPVLIAKNHPQLKDIEAVLLAECKRVWGEKWKDTWEEVRFNAQKCAWKDGDRGDDDRGKGHFVLTAGRDAQKKGAPFLCDLAGKSDPILEVVKEEGVHVTRVKAGKQGRFYSGCIVNISVDIYAQAGKNKGLRCDFLGMQWFKDADAFGPGAAPSQDDFEDIADGAAAPAVEASPFA